VINIPKGNYIAFYKNKASVLYLPEDFSKEGYLIRGIDLENHNLPKIKDVLPIFKKENNGNLYYCFYTPKKLNFDYKKVPIEYKTYPNSTYFSPQNFYISISPLVLDKMVEFKLTGENKYTLDNFIPPSQAAFVIVPKESLKDKILSFFKLK